LTFPNGMTLYLDCYKNYQIVNMNEQPVPITAEDTRPRVKPGPPKSVTPKTPQVTFPNVPSIPGVTTHLPGAPPEVTIVTTPASGDTTGGSGDTMEPRPPDALAGQLAPGVPIEIPEDVIRSNSPLLDRAACLISCNTAQDLQSSQCADKCALT